MDSISRNGRITSSSVFPDDPNSERGAFVQFMEESGANTVLTRALSALYNCPKKPDTPIQWLVNYFRQFVPRRSRYIYQMKETICKRLIDLEALTLRIKEEQRDKEELLRKIRGLANDDICSLSEENEVQDKFQQEIDNPWLLAPDPFFKSNCSTEQLSLLKTKEEIYDIDHVKSYSSPSKLFTNLQLECRGEEEGEVEYEEWINAYNVYKITSKLPETKQSDKKNSKENIMDQIKAESKSKNTLETQSKSDNMSKETIEIHPDSLPPNYWVPNFTLDCENRQQHGLENDSSDESDTGINDSNIFYRPSKGSSCSLDRPTRSDINYDNMWQTEHLTICESQKMMYATGDINSRLNSVKASEEQEQEISSITHLQTKTSSMQAHFGGNDQNVISNFQSV